MTTVDECYTCACGADFNLTHALHCAKGGYTHIRHNEIRDTFANLMNEVCHDVEIEPKLQPLQGESFVNNSTTTEDEARLDIKANGLWGSRFSRAFFDVKIFNPYAKTSRKLQKDAYKYHETLKNSKYQQRILNVEQNFKRRANFWMHRWRCSNSHADDAAIGRKTK